MNTAVILCAGFGTRLKGYTENLPKPMLTAGNKPILEYTIRHLAGLNIRNVIINLHYLPARITSYFRDGGEWGVKIRYSYEKRILGTAGAVKKVESVLSKEKYFLVLHGDVIYSGNYLDLLAFHRGKRDAVGSIVVHRRKGSNSALEMDGNGRITKFVERPKKRNPGKKEMWVNSGLYCFSREVLNHIPEEGFSDFPQDIFPLLVKEGRLYGYPIEGYRCAVDSPGRYALLREDAEKGLLK